MIYEHNLSKFLEKNKDSMSLEEYIGKFYRNLRMHGQHYEEEQYDDLLTELYMKEPEVYIEWQKVFTKVPYFFVRSNTVLSTYLVSSNCSELMTVAYDMEKKRKSIISRIFPMKASITTVNSYKEKLIKELENLKLLLISEEEDNILRKSQEEFARCYGEYNDDPYLNDYYNSIIDNFEYDIRTNIESEIAKANNLDYKLKDINHKGHVVDNIIQNSRNHKSSKFFKQTFK